MEPWSLVSYAEAGAEHVGALRQDGQVVALPESGGARDVVELLCSTPDLRSRFGTFDAAAADPVEGVRLLAPLRYPRKVLCSGPNFTDHLAEMGESTLGDDWEPFFFLKPPTTTVVGPADIVLIPAVASARPDWEGELGVVIGRGGQDIRAAEALRHVAGYTVVNDISLRGPHQRPSAPAPFVWDWLASKGTDGSLPCGPGITPAWFVPDPQDLRITTCVNGRVMQSGTTANMIHEVSSLVAAASRLVTLEPGDLLATGTPAGVGAGRGTFLTDGDVVSVTITTLGTIENRIEARDPGAAAS